MPVPFFYQSNTMSVAIVVAEGDCNLADTTRDTLSVLPDQVAALGIFLDADSRLPPTTRFAQLVEDLSDLPELQFEDSPGLVANGAPRCGVFIFPDNENTETLEEILIECAKTSYPKAVQEARKFVASVTPDMFPERELRDFNRPSGRQKSTVATLAAVLKPGKSIQVSITDNQWVTSQTLNLPSMVKVDVFLQELLSPRQ